MAGQRLEISAFFNNGNSEEQVRKLRTSITELGRSAKATGASMKGAGSDMYTMSSGLRVMEGNVTNSTRTVARFLMQFQGAAAIMQAAFPLIGLVALGGMIYATEEKIRKFVKGMQEMPHEVAHAFRELTAPMQRANDELRLQGARLDQDIARLQGKPTNNLALAINEAVVQADKLSDSLEKALEAWGKVNKEKSISGFRSFFTGEASTGADDQRSKKLAAEIEDIDASGLAAVRAARDKKDAHAEEAAQLAWNEAAQRRLNAAIREYGADLGRAQSLQRVHESKGTKEDLGAFYKEHPAQKGSAFGPNAEDQSVLIERLKGGLHALSEAYDGYTLSLSNNNKEKVKGKLEDANSAERAERPYDKAVAELIATTGEARAKLETVGASPEERARIEALALAKKKIAELNEEEKRYHRSLTADQKTVISDLTVWRAKITEVAKAYETLYDATVKSAHEAAASDLMAGAAGRGYAAERAAKIEAELMAKMGTRYGEDSKQADILRAQERYNVALAFDAKHNEELAVTVAHLKEETRLQDALAGARGGGRGAVRQVELQDIRERGLRQGDNGWEVAAKIDAYLAKEKDATATELAGMQQKMSATQALMGARTEAQRREIEAQNAYNEAWFKNNNAEVARAAADEVRLKYQESIVTEANKEASAYTDQADKNRQILEILRQRVALVGKSLETQLAISKTLDDQRKLEVDILLKQDSAMAGVKAFFTEMQEQGERTAQIIKNAMTSALDGVSSQLAKLVTGQKTDFAKMFQGIGETILKDSFKSAMQKGLGALGGKLFPGGNPLVKRDGNSEATALFVKQVGGTKAAGVGQGADSQSGVGALKSALGVGGGGGSGGAGGASGDSGGRGLPGGMGTEMALMGAEGAFIGTVAKSNLSTKKKILASLGIHFGMNALGVALHLAGQQGMAGDSGGSGGAGGAGGANGAPTGGGDPYSGMGVVGANGAPASGTLPFAGYMASGGDMTPGMSYITGEAGAERIDMGRSSARVTPLSHGSETGGGTTYIVNAPGSELGAENRIRRTLESVHQSAVANSVRANAERVHRTPQRSPGRAA